MKNLLLTIDFPPRRGGVANYLNGLASAFPEQIFVVADKQPGAVDFDQAAKYKISRRNLYFPFWPRWIKSLFIVFKLNKNFDQLIISHILPLGLVAFIAKVILNKPYILIVHGLDLFLAGRNSWKSLLRQIIIENAKLVIANSKFIESKVLEIYPQAQTLIIHPCPTEKLFKAAEEHRKTLINTDKIRLISVARLVPRKGHLLILEALAQLPNAEYLSVGDGPEYENIWKKAQELNLLSRIKFVRRHTDEELYDFYKQSDIFVMPTLRLGPDVEGFGTVFIEANAFGLPVIASRAPGVDEAVLDGTSGILVPENNAQEIEKAIKKLSEPIFYARLSEAGRQRALNDFRWIVQTKKLEPYL